MATEEYLNWLVDDWVDGAPSLRSFGLNDDSPSISSPYRSGESSPSGFSEEPSSPFSSYSSYSSSTSAFPSAPSTPSTPSFKSPPTRLAAPPSKDPSLGFSDHHSDSISPLQYTGKGQAVYDEASAHIKVYDEQLARIRTMQHAYLVQNAGSLDELKTLQSRIFQAIRNDVKLLEALLSSELLLPLYLHRIDRMLLYLRLQAAQVELFNQELRTLSQDKATSGGMHVFARLCIASQPISGVITKGKQVEEASVIVKLIFGVTMRFSSVSHMKVSVLWDDQQARIASSAEKSLLEVDVLPLDVYRFQTHWKHKFSTGTRKTPIFLRYSLSVRLSESHPPFEIRSEWSRPYIVITNDCQWYEAEGKLIQHWLFKPGALPWPLVANTVQRHFLEGTRQDPAQAQRILFANEFHYFFVTLFCNKHPVTAVQFDQFWEWFGKCLQRLRYQRHVGTLFLQGYLQGFLTKQACLNILSNQPIGTFLIRFSESYPGCFAVTYRAMATNSPDAIRHYLLKADDISGPKHTIADFLGDQIALTHMLRFGQKPDGKPTITGRAPKDEILGALYAKKAPVSTADGYDTRIHTVKSFIE